MPIYLKNKYGKSIETLKKYCIEKLELKNPQILYPKIKYQSLMKIDGFFYHLSGKTGKQILLSNATPMILERKWVNYIKKIENFSSKKYVEKEITKEKMSKFIQY